MTQQEHPANNPNQFGQADQRPDQQQGGQGGLPGQGPDQEQRTFEQEEQRRRAAQGESVERDNDETQDIDSDRQGDAGEAGVR